MEVLRTGKAVINPVLDQAHFERLTRDPEMRAVAQSFGVRSNLLVPLLVRGRVIGVLSVAITASSHRFSERDLPLLEELGRRAAQAIENAQLYLKATTAVSLREKVLSVVSHDLRNPLNVVLMQSSILEQRLKRTPDPALDWLNKPLGRITSGATRMRAMLEDLVDVARLQAGGQLTLHLEPTDLAALTRSVVEEFLSTSRGRRIQLTSPASLLGVWDRSRIERVIANLVSNALKYSPKETVVDVELRVEPEADPGQRSPGQRGEAVLVVRDRGLGIPARDLPRLFDWFHRGANVQGRIEGTGVGLASVRLILEQHRGSIAVESREGEGSTFTVRLPLDAPEAETAAP
jgi:signal transduction histidine kinase